MKKNVKKIIEYVINKLSLYMKYTFPETFIWKWKLDYLLESYEYETTQFFKKNIKKGMVVVDVGANIGYFTRIFSDLVGETGKVYAFEPDEENFELLKRNTAHLSNVEIIKSAVSDYSGNINFFHVVGATGTHSLISSSNSELRNINCCSLDDFFKDKQAPEIIKIDVEGAESQVFKGMSNLLANKDMVVIFEYQQTSNPSLIKEISDKYILYSISRSGILQDFEKIKFYKGKVPYANVCIVNKL